MSEPRAFFAIDQGAATTSAALVGHASGHWRLLGALALPTGIPLEAILDRLLERVLASDPGIGREIGAADLGTAASWPRLVARSAVPPWVAVLAATEATRDRLVKSAAAAGWRTSSGSVERDGPLELLRLALDPGVHTVMAGTLDPPAGAERSRIGQLGALLTAIEDRRSELTLVIGGGLASAAAVPVTGEPVDGTMPATRLFAPGPGSEGPLDDPLVAFLDRLRARPNDAIGGIVRATATLAGIVGRRVETVSIGLDAGARVAAWPTPPTDTDEPAGTAWRAAIVPDAGLVPEALDEDIVGGVMAWSTVAMDRIRMRDRLAEMRRSPWGDADGDGAALRLAAARAALVRLVDATPAIDELPPPDLIVATGGAFAVAPGPAVALALADTLRRPAACQLALDHARLLAPLGVVPEESQRRRLMEDLVDDLLAPLGSVISPQGLRAGRSAGRLTIRAGAGLSELELVPGALQLVDLPPGQVATAEFAFSEPVVLGTRGRKFSVEVGGGLGGLLVDLRDVPLRLPDRPEHRRELLIAWQDALWTGGIGCGGCRVIGTPPPGARRAAQELAPGLALVRLRRLTVRDPLVRFPLAVGDRPLVRPGDVVSAGARLAERMAEANLVDVGSRGALGDPAPTAGTTASTTATTGTTGTTATTPAWRSGAWIAAADGPGGELVTHADGRWRMAVGTAVDALEAPAAGVVREVRPGIALSFDVPGLALLGIQSLGGPARGRLEIAATGDGEARPGAIDVGRAGTILVFDARVDAETLSRARAMGVRGIVVAALSDKDGRDFAASEARQRASLHRAAPFGVLVLDGHLRRPIAEPALALLRAHAGREVGIAADPPCLLFGFAPAELPELDPVHVRIAHGPWAGREGRWEGLAGLRRFRAGAHLEAGRIRFDDGTAAVVPLADLERFA